MVTLNDLIPVLVRKELRALRGTYLALALGAVPTLWVVFTVAPKPIHRLPIVLALSWLVCAFLGATTFAEERQKGTLEFLTGLPTGRREVFKAKLAGTLPGVFVALAVAAVVFLGMLDTLTGQEVTGKAEKSYDVVVLVGIATVLGAIALYAAGVFFSLLVDRVVVAALAAIALFWLLQILGALLYVKVITSGIRSPDPETWDRLQFALTVALMFLWLPVTAALILLSRRIFCGPRTRRNAESPERV